MNITTKLKTIVAVTVVVCCCNFMIGGKYAQAAVYQVQSGDTLYKIAGSHNITVKELKQANQLTNNTIYVGQFLQIPLYMQHRVKAGESLYLIARQYDCTVEELRVLNDLNGNTIQPGSILQIPSNHTAAASADRTAVVTASRGGYNRFYTQNEWDMLAQVVYGEARGESYTGQVAVAAVVLNRMEDEDFPDTMYDVVFQQNAFTCVNDGQYYLTPNRTAYQAALDAMHGADPTGGCLYYWNPITATSSWIWSRTIELQIGNHVFGL